MGITTYFFLNKRKGMKIKKPVPILADVKYDVNNKTLNFRFSTGKSCNPRVFAKQTILGGDVNSEEKNKFLKRIKQAAERIYLHGINTGEIRKPKDFKAAIMAACTEAGEAKGTLDYLDDYINHLKAKKKSRSIISAMENLKTLLETMQINGTSLHLDSIGMDFETAMLNLLNDKGHSANTKGSYIKRLKMFLNHCTKNNLNRNFIYKQFEIIVETKEVFPLDDLEINRIYKLPLTKHQHIEKGMKLTRDWFIISTQTGLRFSDLRPEKVSKDNIKPADGGFDLSIFKTQKTGVSVVIPISRILYSVLKEYNFEMPAPPSNQKFNDNLKEIAKKADIKKPLSSHTGRKTFCTIQYRKGVPVPWIMKISGHKTEKEFYKYIGVDLSENSALVRERNDEFKIDVTMSA